VLTVFIWDWIRWVHYLALSLWIGGIIFLSAAVAPSIHSSLAAKAVAGQIVAKTLKRLNTLEIMCCLLLIATLVLSRRFVEAAVPLNVLLGLVLLMGILACFYAFILTPKMERLRLTPGFETQTDDQDMKREFRSLHRVYVRLMSLNLVLGTAVLYGSIVLLST
jgi:uncharacterized membrane protein